MTRPEIYRALADGKAIEGHTYVGKWELLDEREVIEWINGDLNTDSFQESDFRLAPEPVPPTSPNLVPVAPTPVEDWSDYAGTRITKPTPDLCEWS